MIVLTFSGLFLLRLLLIHYVSVLVCARVAVFLFLGSASISVVGLPVKDKAVVDVKYDGVRFPNVKALSFNEREGLVDAYATRYGDCQAPAYFKAEHGNWCIVGCNDATSASCGTFSSLKYCDDVVAHGVVNVYGESHVGEVAVQKVYNTCDSPLCKICFHDGWAMREGDRIAQRLHVAQKRYGLVEHLVISPCLSDWDLADLDSGAFFAKVEKLCKGLRGLIAGCLIFHPFSFADLPESRVRGIPWGWRWHPHIHYLGCLRDSYNKCRYCSRLRRASMVTCAGCGGFESITRRCNVVDKYIFKVLDRENERVSVFGTAVYELSHAGVMV